MYVFKKLYTEGLMVLAYGPACYQTELGKHKTSFLQRFSSQIQGSFNAPVWALMYGLNFMFREPFKGSKKTKFV